MNKTQFLALFLGTVSVLSLLQCDSMQVTYSFNIQLLQKEWTSIVPQKIFQSFSAHDKQLKHRFHTTFLQVKNLLKFQEQRPFTLLPDEMLKNIFKNCLEQDKSLEKNIFTLMAITRVSKQFRKTFYETFTYTKTFDKLFTTEIKLPLITRFLLDLQTDPLVEFFIRYSNQKDRAGIIDKKPNLNPELQLYTYLLSEHVGTSSPEFIELLLARGAQPHNTHFTKDESTPLFSACESNNLAVVRVLLSHNANENQENVCGITPLVIACRQGYSELVSTLLSSRSYHNLEKPLLHACKHGKTEVIKLLTEKGANVNCVYKTKQKTYPQKYYLDGKPRSLREDEKLYYKELFESESIPEGMTPLTIATSSGNQETIHYLLQLPQLKPTKKDLEFVKQKFKGNKKIIDLATMKLVMHNSEKTL